MITIIPYDAADQIETNPDDAYEIVEEYEDGSILVRRIDSEELRLIRKVTVQ